MSDREYDVIIIGLGAMGSAAIYQVAATGARVLGLDRFQPPHDHGSSHGLSRIIREAYFEDPLYVPLVQRAYELWEELERTTGRQLLLKTGGVMVGSPKSTIVKGALRSAEQHRLRHELLSGVELNHRFPGLKPAAGMVGVWEPRAGVLFPELAISTHLEWSAKLGAELRFNEPALHWEPDGDGVRVRTPLATYRAAKLLLAAGPWMASLIPELELPLRTERQVLYWFEPQSRPEAFRVPNCPVYIWEYDEGKFFYGFPDLGDGVKVAVHHEGEPAGPGEARREVKEDEIRSMRELLGRFMPNATGRLRATAVCLYTNTPDEHFILDRHPHYRQVVVASPCSGHGFKFSSAIGEIAAALLRGEKPPVDLSLFRIARLLKS